MPLILLDADGIVVGADDAAGGGALGLPGISDLGCTLLERLESLSAGVARATTLAADAAGLAMALRVVLDGHQRQAEYRSADGQWRVGIDRLSARRPAALALQIQRQVADTGRRDPGEAQRRQDRLEELVVSRTVQLAEARERAEAASRAKSAFLAQTSHEIRSPLNVIISLAHLLGAGEAEPSRLRRMQAIEQAGRHLSSIIDDVLDLARAESNRLALHVSGLRPAGVLEEVAAMLRPEAEDSGLRIEIEPAGEAGACRLRGDAARLRQALLNAGHWAIAAAPGGVLRLRLALGDAVAGRVPLSLEILSQASMPGPALDADPDLLALRRLAQLMNGRCGIDSNGAGGTRCWLRVELERDGVATTTAGAATAASVDRSAAAAVRRRHAGRRVLVAEDEEVNQLVMLDLLSALRLSVDFANDGQAAVEKAARGQPALVIMDLRMPRLDGLAAARAIRKLPGLQQLPIVALTANAFEEDREACKAAGMNDFLAKPIDIDRLHEVLLRWLDQSPVHAATAAPDLPETPPPPPLATATNVDDPLLAPLLALEGVDALGGLASVGGRIGVYRRLLKVFDEAHRDDPAGLQALLEQDDRQTLVGLAHRVRGSAATLGLIDIETTAADLEHAIDEQAADAPLQDRVQALVEALEQTLQQVRPALGS